MKNCSLFVLLILVSCGQSNWWTQVSKTRSPASLVASPAHSYEAYFIQQLEGKLRALHSYYLVGRKNLKNFEQDLTLEPKKAFESENYKRLLAVKLKTEELELAIQKSEEQLQKESQKDRIQVMHEKIIDFSRLSPLSYLTMKNLRNRLKLKMSQVVKVDQKLVEDEQKKFQERREFVTHEMTINHLAYAQSLKARADFKMDTLDWMPQLQEELRLRNNLMGKKGHWETLTERSRDCKMKGMTTTQGTLCPQS
jgi:hypothetical protein